MSAERRLRRSWAGPRLSWRVVVATCLSLLAPAWPSPSEGQTAPPASQREAERRRLLDQLGLKKAPPAKADAEAKEKDKPEEIEKAKNAGEASDPPAPEPGAGEARAEAPPLGFSGAVHQVLVGACRSCHGAGGAAARGSYVLDGTLDADFAATRRHVNPGQPGSSALLRFASGAGHAGGVVLGPSRREYQLLSRWIAEGAKRGAGVTAPPAAVPAAAAVTADTRLTPGPALPSQGAPSALGASAAAAPATVETAPPSLPPAPVGVAGRLAYAPTLHAALSQACSGCHRPGAPAGSTGYVLTGEVAADFASARRLVDLERPEASPLLTKASGAAHGGGAIYPPGSDAHLLLLEWIQFGASGPTDEAVATAPEAASERVPLTQAPTEAAPTAPAAAPHPSMHGAYGKGLSLPLNFRLNGRFDLSYERRNFDTQPFSSGDDAIQSYHHFIFLSRQVQGDPVGFTAELVNLTFWEVNYRLSLPESAGQLWLKAGKLMVPFGPDPLFHQSYGGLAGFDQRVLPAIWAQEGLSGRLQGEDGDVSWSADLYAVRGHELRQRDAVLNLQSDFSPLDSAHVALGARLRASWQVWSLFYSAYTNGLGFGRRLYLQALDLGVWRLRGVPVLEHMAADLGVMRGDVSGGGPGQDYYHFASYFRLRYYLTDLAFLQYRQGLRTFNNRRGVILDDTRLTREDGSTHNFGLVSRQGPLTFGLYYFFNLEKADEVDDDFLRLTGTYDF